jgi:SOS response regulatory protein OraA/RecX
METAYQIKFELKPKNKVFAKATIEGIASGNSPSEAKNKAQDKLEKKLKKDGVFEVKISFLSSKPLPSDFIFR